MVLNEVGRQSEEPRTEGADLKLGGGGGGGRDRRHSRLPRVILEWVIGGLGTVRLPGVSVTAGPAHPLG